MSPTRPYIASFSRSRPRVVATISPIRTAVPDGASILWRWCISYISISTESPRISAAVSIKRNTTLTPTLILGAITIGIDPAATSMSCSPEASNPVVPITIPKLSATPLSRISSVAAGILKSTSTSKVDPSVFAATGTPISPTPATKPASCPKNSQSERSSATTSDRSFSSSMACVNIRPMRPAAPLIATSIDILRYPSTARQNRVPPDTRTSPSANARPHR